jgi:Flp pilus assembly protein TadG
MGNRTTWILLRNLKRDESGATLVEFTLIAVLFFLITFSVIEIGLAAWWWTSAEKATQLGVRMAVVREPMVALPAENVRVAGFNFGQRCADGACTGFATMTCTSASCQGPTFDAIVARMQAVPFLDETNILVTYTYGELGFAGGPVVPLVTVELQNVRFPFIVIDALVNLISGGGFPDGIDMPAMRATLTGEDLHSGPAP